MMESQIVPELEGKVLKKVGKWTIESTKAGLCISDGFFTYWIICYGNGIWGSDAELKDVNKKILKWMDKNCNLYA